MVITATGKFSLQSVNEYIAKGNTVSRKESCFDCLHYSFYAKSRQARAIYLVLKKYIGKKLEVQYFKPYSQGIYKNRKEKAEQSSDYIEKD